MSLETVRLKPSINTLYSQVLNEAGWSLSNRIRWRGGLPEKGSPFQRLTNTPIVGIGRGAVAWADLSAIARLAIGTEQRLQLLDGGLIEDITPLRKITNPGVDFSTVINTKTVTVKDAGHGASAGDWVFINVPVSVGGLIIQGFYQIASVVDANDYTITAASNATATVNHGGAVPSFNTSGIGVTVVTVTLANHGLANAGLFNVQISTTVGGITIGVGTYAVSSVTTNTFQITPGGSASGPATVSENGGNAQIWYLVPTGLASNTLLTGYGEGPYGAGVYGMGGAGSAIAPLRIWALDHWGQDLIGNYTGSPIFIWVPPYSAGNVALAINVTNFPSETDAPVTVNYSFVDSQVQIMFALGVDPAGGGTLDPNLLRWCDQGDFTDWLASSTNQAGSFRFSSGSKLVGGLVGPLGRFFWTDVDFWGAAYLGQPFVYGFHVIDKSAGLMAPHAAGTYEGIVYWPSRSGTGVPNAQGGNFFRYDGNSVQIVPCPVWDDFFTNLFQLQTDKVWCWINSAYGEVWWFYPSAGGNGECDSAVVYRAGEEGEWYLTTLARTCGVDSSPLGTPIATDTASLIQQHEIGFDADGQPMLESVSTGFIQIAEGDFITSLERALPDFKFKGANPSITYSLIFKDYPNDAPRTYGPYTASQLSGGYNVCRGKGRYMSIQVNGTALGSWWRFEGFKYRRSPAGKRP